MSVEKEQILMRQEEISNLTKIVLSLLFSCVFIFLGVVISLYANEVATYFNISTDNIEKIFLSSVMFYLIATLPIIFALPQKKAEFCLVFIMGYLLGNYPVIIEDLVTKKANYLQNELKQTEHNREA